MRSDIWSFWYKFFFFGSLRMVKTSHQTSHLPFHAQIEPEIESIHSFRKERKKERKEERRRRAKLHHYLLTYFPASPFSPGQRPVYRSSSSVRSLSIYIHTFIKTRPATTDLGRCAMPGGGGEDSSMERFPPSLTHGRTEKFE